MAHEATCCRGGAPAARLAHNQKITGSIPVTATKIKRIAESQRRRLLCDTSKAWAHNGRRGDLINKICRVKSD